MLTGNSLNFWLAESGIRLSTIGAATLVTLPYAINFLWAPLLERWAKHTGLRSALLRLTCGQALLLVGLGYTNPSKTLVFTMVLASGAALVSSSQDILLNVIRTGVSQHKNLGTHTSGYVIGYRAGMLVGGAGSILAAKYMDWSYIYGAASLLLLSFMLFLVKHLKYDNQLLDTLVLDTHLPSTPQTLWQIATSIAPGRLLMLILVFLVLYRAGDSLLSSMLNPMLLLLDFSNEMIAGIGKTLGMAGSIIGGIIGGIVVNQIGLKRSLWILGIMHAFSNLLFILLWVYPHDVILALVVIISSGTGGMCMSAYIAFITSLCKGRHRGTKYSFLSSMMGLSRAVFPIASGWIIELLGWQSFLVIVFASAWPSLWIIRSLLKELSINHT